MPGEYVDVRLTDRGSADDVDAAFRDGDVIRTPAPQRRRLVVGDDIQERAHQLAHGVVDGAAERRRHSRTTGVLRGRQVAVADLDMYLVDVESEQFGRDLCRDRVAADTQCAG